MEEMKRRRRRRRHGMKERKGISAEARRRDENVLGVHMSVEEVSAKIEMVGWRRG